jgi:hypothetical protein
MKYVIASYALVLGSLCIYAWSLRRGAADAKACLDVAEGKNEMVVDNPKSSRL